MLAQDIAFQGCFVRCEPLRAIHAPALFAITPPETFQYFLSWPRGAPSQWDLSSFTEWMASHTENPKTRAFVVIDAASEKIVGSSAYMDLDPANRALEIGCTWFAPDRRGTEANPECKLLMLRYAFEQAGVVRVTLKCDARNIHSQRAIAKLGAVREGVLRKHRIQQNGFVRDTVMFGITDEEWPEVRRGLEARLGAI